ncbi:MAG TPA: hypothetical protein VHN74_00360 [Candidatus Angelobacter sp.]|jgi:hypothetical protein|nr:hypothetical protein [Candidatus Angelobacter sp.]
MSANYPYIVRCNDCDYVSEVFMGESEALNDRDFHSFDKLHSVSIWRYAWENWTLVTELSGVELDEPGPADQKV